MITPPWRDAFVVEEGLLRRAIAAVLGVNDIGLRPFGEGWDNTAFLVLDGARTLVVRVARRAIAVPLLRTEARVLPALAPHLPVAIPAPALVTEVATCTGERVPVVGYPIIEGTTLCRAGLGDNERHALARPLGAFVRTLHGISDTKRQALELPADELHRADLGSRVGVTHERLRAAHGLSLIGSHEELEALLGVTPPARAAGVDVCVHGDLYARHLVVDADGALSGVIDWGDVHEGDRALDLAVAHLALPATAHAAFLKAYGPVDDITWARARVRAVFSAASTAVYGADIGDAALIEESHRALARLAAEARLTPRRA